MNTQLKADLEAALNKWLDKAALNPPQWRFWIHHELIKQMANAAEMVFDSAQDAQEFMKEEGGTNHGPG